MQDAYGERERMTQLKESLLAKIQQSEAELWGGCKELLGEDDTQIFY